MSEQSDPWADAGQAVGEVIGGVAGAAAEFTGGELAGGGPEDPIADALGVEGLVNGFAEGASTGGDIGSQLGQDAGQIWDDVTGGAPGYDEASDGGADQIDEASTGY
jgi:hypothetical protein